MTTADGLTPLADLDDPYEPQMPDNPLVDGDTEYSVRLVYVVNADNPEHARTRFIAMLNDFGLNNWAYRVTDLETEVEYLVQDGAIMTPQEFIDKISETDLALNDEDGVPYQDDTVTDIFDGAERV